jgi:hypothetical protein
MRTFRLHDNVDTWAELREPLIEILNGKVNRGTLAVAAMRPGMIFGSVALGQDNTHCTALQDSSARLIAGPPRGN